MAWRVHGVVADRRARRSLAYPRQLPHSQSLRSSPRQFAAQSGPAGAATVRPSVPRRVTASWSSLTIQRGAPIKAPAAPTPPLSCHLSGSPTVAPPRCTSTDKHKACQVGPNRHTPRTYAVWRPKSTPTGACWAGEYSVVGSSVCKE